MDHWTCQLVSSRKETRAQVSQGSLFCISAWWTRWERRAFLLPLQSWQKVLTFPIGQTQKALPEPPGMEFRHFITPNMSWAGVTTWARRMTFGGPKAACNQEPRLHCRVKCRTRCGSPRGPGFLHAQTSWVQLPGLASLGMDRSSCPWHYGKLSLFVEQRSGPSVVGSMAVKSYTFLISCLLWVSTAHLEVELPNLLAIL